LPGMCKALGSFSSTAKKTNRTLRVHIYVCECVCVFWGCYSDSSFAIDYGKKRTMDSLCLILGAVAVNDPLLSPHRKTGLRDREGRR
jgi:hypothetical protein